MDLIDREALLKKLVFNPSDMFTDRIREIVKEAPTVDAVEVVRCKDCKYSDQYTENIVYCEEYQTGKVIDGFCNLGERRGD